jgi:hypothetical protein
VLGWKKKDRVKSPQLWRCEAVPYFTRFGIDRKQRKNLLVQEFFFYSGIKAKYALSALFFSLYAFFSCVIL